MVLYVATRLQTFDHFGKILRTASWSQVHFDPFNRFDMAIYGMTALLFKIVQGISADSVSFNCLLQSMNSAIHKVSLVLL